MSAPVRPTPARTASTIRKRLLGTALTATLAVGLFAVPMVDPAAAAPSASDKFESAVLKATSAERTKRHESKLVANSCIDKFAESQARAIAKKQRLYHQDLGKIMRTCKLGGVGENVAYGYPSAKATVNAWMHSPGHRENILRKPYRLLGVGAVKDSHGRWWVAEVFGNKL